MIDWNAIESVFLDMDGTLLDLHYDNHFWLTHVPLRYAEKHGMPLHAAHLELTTRYQAVAGTMQWYSVDYWSEQLDLDIAQLKQEIDHLIAVHPHVADFLIKVRALGKRLTLVTNAHHKSLALKMRKTKLDAHFDATICAHDLGIPKEHPNFWHALQRLENYTPKHTLLIDDSLPVLRAARAYGIAHLRAIYRPDSKQPAKDVEEFHAIESFKDITPPST